VGVVVARLEKAAPDQIAQNVNYALKIGYLRNLIADLPDIGTPRPVKAGSLVSIVAAARSGVFLILAESPPPSSQ